MFRKYHHSGAIPLLHTVSPVVAENLSEMLQILIDKGYSFRLITDIE